MNLWQHSRVNVLFLDANGEVREVNVIDSSACEFLVLGLDAIMSRLPKTTFSHLRHGTIRPIFKLQYRFKRPVMEGRKKTARQSTHSLQHRNIIFERTVSGPCVEVMWLYFLSMIWSKLKNT